MGLFGRKGNNAEKNEENKQESVAIKYPFFTLLVEEVLSMTSTEVSVIGNVRGDLIEEGQELFKVVCVETFDRRIGRSIGANSGEQGAEQRAQHEHGRSEDGKRPF